MNIPSEEQEELKQVSAEAKRPETYAKRLNLSAKSFHDVVSFHSLVKVHGTQSADSGREVPTFLLVTSIREAFVSKTNL